MEVWKDIKGFEGIYQISNQGRVKSYDRIIKNSKGISKRKKGKILSYNKNADSYPKVFLKNQKNRKNISIHRLVAEHFIDNPENKICVNHKNGIKTDNRVENLEWATYFENNRHAVKTGLLNMKGEKHHNVKLTRQEALKIKYTHNGLTNKEIAKIYNISKSMVGFIRSGKNWTHI